MKTKLKILLTLVIIIFLLMCLFVYSQSPGNKHVDDSKILTITWFNYNNKRVASVTRSKWLDFVYTVFVNESSKAALYFNSDIYKTYTIIKYEISNKSNESLKIAVSGIELDATPVKPGEDREKEVKNSKKMNMKTVLEPMFNIFGESEFTITLLVE